MGAEAIPTRPIIRPWLIVSAAVLVLSADRWLKSIAWAIEGGSDGLVAFSLFRNYGIAFSLRVPDVVYWPLAFGAVVALGAFAVRETRRGNRWARPLVAVTLLGAASNLIDRAMLGYVIDYLIFFGVSAVNLADGLIVGGLLGLLWHERHNVRAA